jgi:hypothetical protein
MIPHETRNSSISGLKDKSIEYEKEAVSYLKLR